jgi:hypothetical protein
MTNRINALAAKGALTLLAILGCSTPTQPSTDTIYKASQHHLFLIFMLWIARAPIAAANQSPVGSNDWDYLKTIGIAKLVRLNEFASDQKASEEFQLEKDRGIEVVTIHMRPEDAD